MNYNLCACPVVVHPNCYRLTANCWEDGEQDFTAKISQVSTIFPSLSEQIFTSSGSALPQPSEAMLRGAAYTSKEGGEVLFSNHVMYLVNFRSYLTDGVEFNLLLNFCKCIKLDGFK